MSNVHQEPPPEAPGPPGAPGAPGWWPGPQGWPPYVPAAPQPGVIPLRPLGLGDILRAVVAVIRRYGTVLYRQLLGATVGALLVVPAYAVFADAALSGLIRDTQADPDHTPTGGQVAALIGVAGGGYLLLLGFALAIQVIATATSTKLVQHAVLGRPVSARRLAAEARPYLWRVCGSFVLLALGVAAVMVVGLLPAAIAGLAGAGPFSLMLLPLAALAAGAGVYAQVRLVLQMPVLIMEDARPAAAVRRAWRLNEGAWWRSLGIPYLVGMIGSAAAQILMVPFFILGFVLMIVFGGTSADGTWEPGPTSLIALSACLLAGLLVAVVVGAPLAPLTHALLYVDQRIRREGLDIALAQAAGLHPGPATSVPAQAGPPEAGAAQPPTGAPGTDQAGAAPDAVAPDNAAPDSAGSDVAARDSAGPDLAKRPGPVVPAQGQGQDEPQDQSQGQDEPQDQSQGQNESQNQDQSQGQGPGTPTAERPDPEANGPART
ncbi:hypothetical protein [Kitasatospora indigofera]|uniref:hypothetical protein n=1 Tax=Kitasatospora indigofera TaxID=67307 RepID=UPI003694E155